MKFRVINLSRTPERLTLFKKNNPTFKFERFNAIDGQQINRDVLVQNNLATEPVAERYTDGAVGVALSHLELWKECVKLNVPMTILEDDAYLTPNFNELVVEHINKLENWDFIFWGMNLDQKMILELSPGIALAEINYQHTHVLNNIENITKQTTLIPQFYRCYWGVGLVCYSITPVVAKYLIDNIFPLHDYDTNRGPNGGIDNSIIEELPNILAYACIPPIALTKNDRYNSTVQEN